MMIGGFGRYQWVASFLIITAVALNFLQLWALNLLLLEPKYKCQQSESTSWVSCSLIEACQSGNTLQFDYSHQSSFTNFFEQMHIMCEDRDKILMVPGAQIVTSFLAVVFAPIQVRTFGMRSLFLLMTLLQALITAGFLFVESIDMLICLSILLGLTSNRQAFALEFLANYVPNTHFSFVSMWYIASMAAAVLATTTYFFLDLNTWHYFLITSSAINGLIAIIGSCILVESPMQLLLNG